MNWQWIEENIAFLPAEKDPLSSDVGMVRTASGVWLFDLGCTAQAVDAIKTISEKPHVVLSHFHLDHIGNLERVQHDALYAGAYTCKKIGEGVAIRQSIQMESGICLFPIPSSHAKGCIGMEYDGYAFLGDAIYPKEKEGKLIYNVSLLAQQIQTLNALRADRFLISHKNPLVRPKTAVLSWLQQIYSKRKQGQAYLCLE